MFCVSMKRKSVDKENDMGINGFPNEVWIEIGIAYWNSICELNSKESNQLFLKFILISKFFNGIMIKSIKHLSDISSLNGKKRYLPIRKNDNKCIQMWLVKNRVSKTFVIPYWREKFGLLDKNALKYIKHLEIVNCSIPSLKLISKMENLQRLVLIRLDFKYFGDLLYDNTTVGVMNMIFDEMRPIKLETLVLYSKEFNSFNLKHVKELKLVGSFCLNAFKNIRNLKTLSLDSLPIERDFLLTDLCLLPSLEKMVLTFSSMGVSNLIIWKNWFLNGAIPKLREVEYKSTIFDKDFIEEMKKKRPEIQFKQLFS